MMDDYSSDPKWYVVHTYSGYENKVMDNILKIVENRSLQEVIKDIKIPLETSLEMDGSSEKTVENKVFPSYVLVKMVMNDSTWHVIRNIRGVTGFVGPGSKPVSLTDEEVVALGIENDDNGAVTETKSVSVGFGVGDSVKITGGLLDGNIAKVEEISADFKKVKVLAFMFGHETSIELDLTNVESIK